MQLSLHCPSDGADRRACLSRCAVYEVAGAKVAEDHANNEQQEAHRGNEGSAFNASRTGQARQRPSQTRANDQRS